MAVLFPLLHDTPNRILYGCPREYKKKILCRFPRETHSPHYFNKVSINFKRNLTKKPLKAIPNLREASSISSEKETKNVVDKKTMTHNGIEIAGIPKDEWLKLQKPARYLGNEFGAVHKDWQSAAVRFCLSYPEIYEVGASNLGHILLYTVLNEDPDLLCDRCYFPAQDMSDLLKKYQKRLFALESQKSLSQFDCVGFSLSYELGGTNILEMLHQSGIPLTWQERRELEKDEPWDVEKGNSYPLIFAGGPTATSNPEPFSDFFDFFSIGDGEDSLPEIGRCLKQCKSENLNRRESLIRLATTVKGVYVPQLYERLPGWGGAVFPVVEGIPERVLRRVAMPDPFKQIGLVPYVETVHDRLTVEIRRGCTRGCRFCQPGMLTRPARDVEPEKVVQAVQEGTRKTGYTEFSLLSLSCSDYLALPAVGIEIKNRMQDTPVSLSLPSQRVDRFNDDIAAIIGGTRQGSLTFAPEAGTQRMRDIINKGLTDEELLRGVKTAWEKGWKQVKLYFMIGLPGETDDDVLGIARTIKWLQQNCRRGRQFIAVRLTISSFTPKPHTPFQWHSVSTAELKRKQSLLKGAFAKMGQVKYSFNDFRLSAMEDFIGRGDRSLGKVMRRAWELGATNDAWWMSADSNFTSWQQAIEEGGLTWKYRQIEDGEWDVMEVLSDPRYRSFESSGRGKVNMGPLADARLNAPLPWDIIDTGISKQWLKADLQRALEALTVEDCSHSGFCSKCGVCGDDFGDNVVEEAPEIPEFKGQFKPNITRAQRIRVRYTKEGSLTLIGHLDVYRLWDRALRRAGISVSFDAGLHAHPRISTCQPISLGFSSSSEMVDIDLTEVMDISNFKALLQEQLPTEISLVDVSEVPVRFANGKITDSLMKQTYASEFIVALTTEFDTLEVGYKVKDWVTSLLALPSFEVEVKSKKMKTKKVDLRGALLELKEQRWDSVPKAMKNSWQPPVGLPYFLLRYVGKVDSEKGNLKPDGLTAMLREVSKKEFKVLHVHRSNILLNEQTKPQVDHLFLRSMAHYEGYLALYRRFDGSSFLDGNQPTDSREAAISARKASLQLSASSS